jgi:hypothetical protein
VGKSNVTHAAAAISPFYSNKMARIITATTKMVLQTLAALLYASLYFMKSFFAIFEAHFNISTPLAWHFCDSVASHSLEGLFYAALKT